MEEKKITIKRFFAYFIDMVIVLIIGSLFSDIDILNPNLDKYKESYESYYKYVLENKNLDLKDESLSDISYDMSKYGISISIIGLVTTFLYFGIFQYYNNGQTIGKKLCKVRVVSSTDKKLKITQVIGRSLIINSLLTSVLITISLILLSKSAYIITSDILQIIDMILVFTSIAFISFREDGRGLHDLFAGTIVIPEYKETIKEVTVIEEKKEVADNTVDSNKSKKKTAKKPVKRGVK